MSGTSALPIEYYSGSASHDYEGQSHATTYLDGSSTAAATVYVAPGAAAAFARRDGLQLAASGERPLLPAGRTARAVL